MKLYSTIEWKEFRDGIIELDGNKCSECGRNGNDVILQVHHKKYIEGRKPWEYGLEDCITLCKGCHAAEHGIIIPKKGWKFLAESDLGERIGICENCGTQIRYSFLITHENWGTLEVGIHCCDNLTESNTAKEIQRYKSRKQRFIKSKKWKRIQTGLRIKLSIFDVEIQEFNGSFSLAIYGYKSSIKYNSEKEAKSKAFDVIESKEIFNIIQGKKF